MNELLMVNGNIDGIEIRFKNLKRKVAGPAANATLLVKIKTYKPVRNLQLTR